MENLNQLETSDDDLKYPPPDLYQDILARLPVKTLLRFRCVCKYWCSIIDSSVFTYLHRNHYENNPHKNSNLVLCLETHDRIPSLCVRLRSINTFHRIGEKIGIDHKGRCCTFVGSCKGLLLTRCVVTKEIRLWNFSIRKSLLLPRCPIWNGYSYVNYVVGFAPSTNDYKVVAFTDNSMAVYSLRDHCWKVKSNTMFMNPCWNVRRLYFHDVIFVEKAAYWFEFFPSDKYQHNRIVSFDSDMEEFHLFKLPDHVVWNEVIAIFLCSIEDSLAVFSVSNKKIRVWILEKDRGNGNASWRVWFCEDIDVVFCKLIRERRYLLSSKILYLQDNGTFIITLDMGQLISYNITTREIQCLIGERFYGGVDTYVESLVSHTDPKWNASYIYVCPRR